MIGRRLMVVIRESGVPLVRYSCVAANFVLLSNLRESVRAAEAWNPFLFRLGSSIGKVRAHKAR